MFPERNALFDLIRLPAVLSIPGDTLSGAAASRSLQVVPGVIFAGASTCLYWAGMSLNDYADREIDAKERPNRPIPSGRVTPEFALKFAGALTAAGIGLATVAGGKKGFATSSAVAGSVWAYDTVLKNTPLAPAAMASCRFFDVVMGASNGKLTHALPNAAIVGAHTLALTTVSRQEVEGGSSEVPQRAKTATFAIIGAASLLNLATSVRSKSLVGTLGSAASLVLFAKPVLEAQQKAINDPTPANMQKVVGSSIGGMIPLQASMLASTGRVLTAALVASGWKLGRNLAKKRAIT